VTLGRTFYSLLFKQEAAAAAAAAAQLLPRVLPYRITTGGLYYKYSNYTVHYLYNYNMD